MNSKTATTAVCYPTCQATVVEITCASPWRPWVAPPGRGWSQAFFTGKSDHVLPANSFALIAETPLCSGSFVTSTTSYFSDLATKFWHFTYSKLHWSWNFSGFYDLQLMRYYCTRIKAPCTARRNSQCSDEAQVKANCNENLPAPNSASTCGIRR